jgi:hypothetical protein
LSVDEDDLPIIKITICFQINPLATSDRHQQFEKIYEKRPFIFPTISRSPLHRLTGNGGYNGFS